MPNFTQDELDDAIGFLTPTAEQMDDLIDLGKQMADLFIPGPNCLYPQLLVLHRSRKRRGTDVTILSLGDEFNSHVEKRAALMGAARILYDDGGIPMAAALVSEGWLSAECEGKSRKFLTPEDDPNRLEVAAVSAVGFKTDPAFCYREYGRDAAGLSYWLCDWVDNEEAELPLVSTFFVGYSRANELAMEKSRS